MELGKRSRPSLSHLYNGQDFTPPFQVNSVVPVRSWVNLGAKTP